MDLTRPEAFLLNMLPDRVPHDIEDNDVRRICMALWLAKERGLIHELPILNWPMESRHAPDAYLIYTKTGHHPISFEDVSAALVAPWAHKAVMWAFHAQAYGLWLGLAPAGKAGLILLQAVESVANRVSTLERTAGLAVVQTTLPSISSIAREHADRITGLVDGKLHPTAE